MRLEVVAVGVILLAGRAGAADDPVLETDADRLSYGMGVGMARSLERQGIRLDPALVSRGLQDALAGRKLLMSDAELRAAVSRSQGELKARRTRAARTPAEAKREGEAFLVENARKEGVVTTASGLQYRVLKTGDGPRPTSADRVLCHYRGTFVDGTEFDSSYRRGRPAVFEVAKVIPGWREALQLMPVGSRWQLFVPSNLAYGEKGMRGRSRAPAKIGPNATLVFETELLAIPLAPGGGGEKTAAAAGAAFQEN